MQVSEIVYRVKKGGFNPLRPTLSIDPTLELNPSIVSLKDNGQYPRLDKSRIGEGDSGVGRRVS